MEESNRLGKKKVQKKHINITNLMTLEYFLLANDNSEDNFYISNVPDLCKEYPCVVGIDEAGRGPVLGPMVYGIAFCPINNMTLMEKLECADSKVLKEEKRDEIFENICCETERNVGWAVEVISPNTICNNMLSCCKYSLNRISMDAAVKLIKAILEAGVNVAHIYVDTVGKPETYQALLKSMFPDYKITVAKKADSTYPVVSMASICAKVTRDHSLKVWQFEKDFGIKPEQLGSGYPSDPVTKRFLKENCDPVFGFPQVVRFSWSTAEEAMKEAYFVEWEDEGKEENVPNRANSVASFFKIAEKPVIRKSHKFFTERSLSRKTEF